MKERARSERKKEMENETRKWEEEMRAQHATLTESQFDYYDFVVKKINPQLAKIIWFWLYNKQWRKEFKLFKPLKKPYYSQLENNHQNI